MIDTIKSLFIKSRQTKLFLLLLLSSVFCCSLIGIRLSFQQIDSYALQNLNDLKQLKSCSTFLFLIWNLFLAWVPYWIALLIKPSWESNKSKIILSTLVLSWLVFFPNAPYILTDLLHLRHRPPVPFWFDMMILISFAWTGLLLGLASLFEVQKFVEEHKSRTFGVLFSIGSILLCGIGIYLGRVLRWNTWDILVHPYALVLDVVSNIMNPAATGYTIGLGFIISIFMLIAYFTLLSFSKEASKI